MGRQTLSSIVYRVLSVAAAAAAAADNDENGDGDDMEEDDVDESCCEHTIVVVALEPLCLGPNRLSDMKAKADFFVIWQYGAIISVMDRRKATTNHRNVGTTLITLLQGALRFKRLGSLEMPRMLL